MASDSIGAYDWQDSRVVSAAFVAPREEKNGKALSSARAAKQDVKMAEPRLERGPPSVTDALFPDGMLHPVCNA